MSHELPNKGMRQSKIDKDKGNCNICYKYKQRVLMQNL